jgi:hypothetical protein
MNPDAIRALEIMGRGMAGIFIALSIIYVYTLGLTKFFPEKKEQKADEN